MIVLALLTNAPVPDSACEDLPGLLGTYQRTQNQQLVVQLLECIEGPGYRLSIIFASLIRDQDERQDCIQDFFIKMTRYLLRAEIRESIPGYIKSSARNHSLNFLRDNSTYSEPIGGEDDPASNTPDATPSAEEDISMKQFLKVAEEIVSEENWETIRLVYLDGLSYKEVAEQLDIRTSTVRGRVQNGIKKLREQFGERFWDFFGED